jgi:phosphohistidine phosphatase
LHTAGSVQLYLMRHGEAASAEQDPRRPLTPHGRAAIERVAARAATSSSRPDAIYHSGIVRAQQTAEILAHHLGVADAVRAREGLEPDDPVPPVAEWLFGLANQADTLALVGHLPFLERLASMLLVGDPQAQVLIFEPGTLAKLTPGPAAAGFAVNWMLAPGVV